MYHGPKGPVSGRTPRTIAEANTSPSEFPADKPYHYQGGYPITAETPKSEYKPQAIPALVQSTPANAAAAPFTIKK